jgi:hypothetical protein
MSSKIFYLFFLLFSFGIQAQNAPKLPNAEVDSLTLVKFERAKKLMEDSLFFKANEVFVDLLTPDEVLPDDICYYFGKNLYTTGYKKQSRAFLYQYLALRDTSDQFFQPAVDLLKLLGEDMRRYDPIEEISANDTTGTEETDGAKKITNRHDGTCHPDEVFMCPVCNGTTVLVRRGSFGNSYQTCPYCDENGIMDCDTYKLYLSGELYNR